MLGYGKICDRSIDELDGETGGDIGGGHRRDEGAGIIGSGTGVGRRQACVGGRGLDTKECLLTLGDVDGDGESVENERKEEKDACLPPSWHGWSRSGKRTEQFVTGSQRRPTGGAKDSRTCLGCHYYMFGFLPAGNSSAKIHGERRDFQQRNQGEGASARYLEAVAGEAQSFDSGPASAAETAPANNTRKSTKKPTEIFTSGHRS